MNRPTITSSRARQLGAGARLTATALALAACTPAGPPADVTWASSPAATSTTTPARPPGGEVPGATPPAVEDELVMRGAPAPPREAPDAEPAERYGAQMADERYPLVIDAPSSWPAVSASRYPFADVYPRDRTSFERPSLSYSAVVEAAVADLFEWDTNAQSLAEVDARGREWFVDEAQSVVAAQYAERWEALTAAGSSARVQDLQETTEWGAPGDTPAVAYRGVTITVRLTDRGGAERVEQWAGFFTLTTVREGRATPFPYRVITTYRLAPA